MSDFKYPNFLGPTDSDELDRAFSRIATSLLSGDVVEFMFGAGMSVTSEVPAGKALAIKLLRYLFPEDGHDPPSDERIESFAS
jgi:hypothetical protein